MSVSRTRASSDFKRYGPVEISSSRVRRKVTEYNANDNKHAFGCSDVKIGKILFLSCFTRKEGGWEDGKGARNFCKRWISPAKRSSAPAARDVRLCTRRGGRIPTVLAHYVRRIGDEMCR